MEVALVIFEPLVSQNPEKSAAPIWRSLLGTGLATAFAAFALLFSTWGWRQVETSHVGYRPDTTVMAPLVNAGPIAWLIASLAVGVVAVLIRSGVRWWRSSR
jgi:hypothetical protein